MADATPTRLGQINNSGDTRALFLKQGMPSIYAAYKRAAKMRPNVENRTIRSGKSAQFRVMGKASAERHTPGVEITGQDVPQNEKVINIDSKLISPVEISDIDEAMDHHDVRGQLFQEIGESLATVDDKQLLQLRVLAARASANYTGGFGGSRVTNANAKTDASVLASLLKDSQVTLLQKDGAEMPLGIFRPAQYHLLAAHPDAINVDYGGQGSIATGTIRMLHGVKLMWSNNLPTTNISAETGTNNTYHGDFSTTVGSVGYTQAVARVSLMGFQFEQGWDRRRQVHLLLAKEAMGAGILRPEAAVEIATGAVV